MRSLIFSLYMTLSAALGPGFTQPLKEITEDFSVSEVPPARKADKLTAICESIV
jgi:hypothetical protein